MYSFKAKVAPGQGLGRRFGFPTANLDKKSLSIDYGVYAVKVKLAQAHYQGLMHYGPKKTFDGEVSCEVYLKDFSKSIYGRALTVEVGRKIREVRKFDNAEALKKQISKDLLELGRF